MPLYDCGAADCSECEREFRTMKTAEIKGHMRYHGEIFGDIGNETFVIEALDGYGFVISVTVTSGALNVTLNLSPEQASELVRHLTGATRSLGHG